MAPRAGMANLIARWRKLVDDAGTAVFDDDEAQEILDLNRRDVWERELTPIGRFISGTTQYRRFLVGYPDLEESSSGTEVWRLYDRWGEDVTEQYTPDYLRGELLFDQDQAGSARFLDFRAYDLNGAAAEGWRRRKAKTAQYYNYSRDGMSMSRSQWFEHCEAMVQEFSRKAWLATLDFERDDCNAD